MVTKAADPTIVYPIGGLGDLLREGNQDERHNATVSWRKDEWGASVSAYRIGDFYQELSNGDRWNVPSMTTYSMTLDYSFDVGETDTRARFGMLNFTDQHRSIDSSFGFSQDASWGRTFSLDLRMQF